MEILAGKKYINKELCCFIAEVLNPSLITKYCEIVTFKITDRMIKDSKEEIRAMTKDEFIEAYQSFILVDEYQYSFNVFSDDDFKCQYQNTKHLTDEEIKEEIKNGTREYIKLEFTKQKRIVIEN